MFHLAAFLGAQAGALTLTPLPALSDGYVPLSSSGNFLFQKDFRLTWAMLISDALPTNFRFVTPKYRYVSIPTIFPMSSYAGSVFIGPGAQCYLQPPYLTVPRLDEFGAEITVGQASTINTIALINAHDGDFTIPQGDIYSIRATAAITATASVWSRGNLTFDQNLPGGRYAVVGGHGFGATLRAWRLRFSDATMLPGHTSGGTSLGTTAPEWRHRQGRQGKWGEFDQTAPPTVEVLCTAADTAQTFVLDIIKIR